MAVDPELHWFFCSPKYRLRSLYRSVRSLGIFAGLRLFLQTSDTSAGLVSVRLPGFRAPVALRKGTSDIGTFEDIFVTGEYSVHAAIDPGVIIDAGANIGCASLYFARKYPSAHIVAVEPSKSNFDLLVRNTKAYDNIKPVHAAVWGRSANLRIENPSALANSFVVIEEEEPSKETIPGMTVRQIAAEAGLDRIDLLKMDIEGAEINVFSSPDLRLAPRHPGHTDRVARQVQARMQRGFLPGDQRL